MIRVEQSAGLVLTRKLAAFTEILSAAIENWAAVRSSVMMSNLNCDCNMTVSHSAVSFPRRKPVDAGSPIVV